MSSTPAAEKREAQPELVIGWCQVCGREALGKPYRLNLVNRIHEFRHVCLDCIRARGEATR